MFRQKLSICHGLEQAQNVFEGGGGGEASPRSSSERLAALAEKNNIQTKVSMNPSHKAIELRANKPRLDQIRRSRELHDNSFCVCGRGGEGGGGGGKGIGNITVKWNRWKPQGILFSYK